jgi:hypothetical protein
MQTHVHPEIRFRHLRCEIGSTQNHMRVMKNIVVLSSLLLTAGYPAVVALSLLPVPSLFEFVGIYVALGVLAFAFRDYGQRSQVTAYKHGSHAPQSAPIPFPQAEQSRDSSATELKAA